MSFLLQILTHLLLDLQKLSWFYIILAKKFKVSYNFKKILHTFQHCQKYWYFLFLCLCASYSQVNIIELFKSTFDGDDSAKFNCKKDELYLTDIERIVSDELYLTDMKGSLVHLSISKEQECLQRNWQVQTFKTKCDAPLRASVTEIRWCIKTQIF